MINIITYKGEKYQQIEIFDNSICNNCDLHIKNTSRYLCFDIKCKCDKNKIYKKLSDVRKNKIKNILDD